VVTLVKLLLGSVAAVVFVWFGANVELGRRTLFEHLQNIGSSKEAKELVGAARETGKPLVQEAKARLVPDAGSERAPLENVTDDDRAQLRKLIRERTDDEQDSMRAQRDRIAADKRRPGPTAPNAQPPR
jgi:hypothetical protein